MPRFFRTHWEKYHDVYSVSGHPGNKASVQLKESLGDGVNSVFCSLGISPMDIRIEKEWVC